jgi:ribose transport system ATP-binding protein
VIIWFFGKLGPTFALGVLPALATLIATIAGVGTARVLRPNPGASAMKGIMTGIGATIASIPLVLAITVSIAVPFAIKRTNLGRALRAAGSHPVMANRMGVRA